jgi:DNA-binding protein H-NS
MSRTPEITGPDVESGVAAVRENAVRVRRAGAEAARSLGENLAATAEEQLSERGFAPDQISEALSENAELARQELVRSSRKSGKELARNAEDTRKELAKRAEAVRKHARTEAAKKAKKSPKKAAKPGTRATAAGAGRQGPPRLLIAFGVVSVLGGIAYLVRRRAAERVAAEQERRAGTVQPGTPEADGQPGANGRAAAPTRGLSSN